MDAARRVKCLEKKFLAGEKVLWLGQSTRDREVVGCNPALGIQDRCQQSCYIVKQTDLKIAQWSPPKEVEYLNKEILANVC